MPIVKRLGQQKLLLDTHVWLWLAGGLTELSPSFRKAAEQASERDLLFGATISPWEIGMLAAKGRIDLEKDPLDWVEESISRLRLQLLPLTPRVAIQSSRIPGNIHGDSADRILVASAREHNAILVTADKQLLEFGRDKFISVYNPQKTSHRS
ncbi:MAG: type II toxin-antitoxin system VapC family toxin [Parachlamydiales bacterium]